MPTGAGRTADLTLSILSPVYNEGYFVDEMIDSVQAQSHQNWEILFVDDGSTDDTVARIQARAAQDPRIKLVSHGVKLGKVAAANAAFAASTGDLVFFIAGDDKCSEGTLSVRAATHRDLDAGVRAVSFYKLRTFSDDPTVDGAILPRGATTSRSGGGMVFSRSLAEIIFPIDEELVAEDFWLRHAAEAQADVIREVPVIVLEYRIHAHNSNPRRRPFPEMSAGMHARHLAYRKLLDQDRFSLTPEGRVELEQLWELELLRERGDVVGMLLTPGRPLVDRLAMASMANPALYKIRSKFYTLFSGWR